MNSESITSPTPPTTPSLSSTTASPDAPLLALIGKTVEQMTDDELRAHVVQLRKLNTTATQMTSLLRSDLGAVKVAKTAKAQSSAKVKQTAEDFLKDLDI